MKKKQKPYLFRTVKYTKKVYNPNYGDDRVCECGHPYYRHFDSYERMRNVGCKYCGCYDFKEETHVQSVQRLSRKTRM